MSDKELVEQPTAEESVEQEETSRYPELDELQKEVARRIRDNQRFLERLESDTFERELEEEEENSGEDDGDDEIFEEL